jgi:hypothetical protein
MIQHVVDCKRWWKPNITVPLSQISCFNFVWIDMYLHTLEASPWHIIFNLVPDYVILAILTGATHGHIFLFKSYIVKIPLLRTTTKENSSFHRILLGITSQPYVYLHNPYTFFIWRIKGDVCMLKFLNINNSQTKQQKPYYKRVHRKTGRRTRPRSSILMSDVCE